MVLYDVDVLASALVSAVCDRDTAALEGYATRCCRTSGDPALHGCFRQMAARARLDELFNSPAAARLHSDYQRGTA